MPKVTAGILLERKIDRADSVDLLKGFIPNASSTAAAFLTNGCVYFRREAFKLLMVFRFRSTSFRD